MKHGITRRRFVGITATALVAAPLLARGSSAAGEPIQIGMIADPQYADMPPKSTRHYRESVGRLAEAVARFNDLPLAFCVNLGDTIDNDFNSFEAILAPLAKSRHRWHHLLGNHDFEVSETDKPRVPGRLGLKSRHWTVDHGRFRFVMLDTNDQSTYAHAAGTPEREAGEKELARLQAAGVRSAKAWNGGVGPAQLAWFERVCRDAAAEGRKVIVFAHHPVLPDSDSNLWNCEPVIAAVERNRNVVAWFNGHRHAGGFAERAGVPYVTLRGMVETPDTNSFATLSIHADRIVVKGYGREISRELRFR